MRVIFAKFPLLSKTHTFSYTLFDIQTSNHYHCNQHAQKPLMQGLSSDFKQFFLVEKHQNFVFVFLRNKYDFQIGNAMEKINSVLILSQQRSSLYIFLSQHHM